MSNRVCRGGAMGAAPRDEAGAATPSASRVRTDAPHNATCAACDDYRFVENESTGLLEACPDCGGPFAVCPVHGQRVMTENDRVVGKCWECVREAAAGLAWLRSHRVAA